MWPCRLPACRQLWTQGEWPGASVRLANGTEKLAIMPNGAVRFAGTLWQPPAMMATSVTVPGTWLA